MVSSTTSTAETGIKHRGGRLKLKLLKQLIIKIRIKNTYDRLKLKSEKKLQTSARFMTIIILYEKLNLTFILRIGLLLLLITITYTFVK